MTQNQIREFFWQRLTFMPVSSSSVKTESDFSEVNSILKSIGMKIKITKMHDGSQIYHLVKLHIFQIKKFCPVLPDIYSNKVVSSSYLAFAGEVASYLAQHEFTYCTESFVVIQGNLSALLNEVA